MISGKYFLSVRIPVKNTEIIVIKKLWSQSDSRETQRLYTTCGWRVLHLTGAF